MTMGEHGMLPGSHAGSVAECVCGAMWDHWTGTCNGPAPTQPEVTEAVRRGAEAAERAVMGYTRPDGTYVQGAVNFWDDSVENGPLIARDVLAAALEDPEDGNAPGLEDVLWNAHREAMIGRSQYTVEANREVLAALRAAILGGASDPEQYAEGDEYLDALLKGGAA